MERRKQAENEAADRRRQAEEEEAKSQKRAEEEAAYFDQEQEAELEGVPLNKTDVGSSTQKSGRGTSKPHYTSSSN
ncbi:unnamed protein product [Sphagnum jensenii]|uniref:Uncharacterized protein n=1 Tax=Sphagnum jensenii TaxID=128206 RepID=A0ABP0WBD9_9BRYO